MEQTQSADLSVEAFHEVMKEKGGFEPRSFDLVVHSDLKWNQFCEQLDVDGKTLVDIGAHVGLMALRFAFRGAMATAIEERKDASAITRIMSERQSVAIACGTYSLSTSFTSKPFQIVMCLGVIHKFPKTDYAKIVKVLCDMCEETLVIETIFNPHAEPALLEERHGGKWRFLTKPTKKYLRALLSANGFEVVKQIPSKEYKKHHRATWIAKRK